MSEGKITAVIVDDHPAVAESVQLALRAAEIDVVGVFSNGQAALSGVKELQPLVAIIDLQLPDLHGSEVVKQISRAVPKTRSLVFSALSSRAQVDEVLDAGAVGFVSKDSPLSDVVRAVRAVADGQSYIDPLIGGHYARDLKQEQQLTPREREILRLLADGLSSDEVAVAIHVSSETVRTHLRNAMTKLGAKNRTHAVVLAIKGGFIA